MRRRRRARKVLALTSAIPDASFYSGPTWRSRNPARIGNALRDEPTPRPSAARLERQAASASRSTCQTVRARSSPSLPAGGIGIAPGGDRANRRFEEHGSVVVYHTTSDLSDTPELRATIEPMSTECNQRTSLSPQYAPVQAGKRQRNLLPSWRPAGAPSSTLWGASHAHDTAHLGCLLVPPCEARGGTPQPIVADRRKAGLTAIYCF